jgi:hypothetical protein
LGKAANEYDNEKMIETGKASSLDRLAQNEMCGFPYPDNVFSEEESINYENNDALITRHYEAICSVAYDLRARIATLQTCLPLLNQIHDADLAVILQCLTASTWISELDNLCADLHQLLTQTSDENRRDKLILHYRLRVFTAMSDPQDTGYSVTSDSLLAYLKCAEIYLTWVSGWANSDAISRPSYFSQKKDEYHLRMQKLMKLHDFIAVSLLLLPTLQHTLLGLKLYYSDTVK